MELSQSEIIQILRRRLGVNQSDLGARAFATSPESGRTKIKNIELGKQVPTYKDLKKLAAVLGVKVADLLPERSGEPAQFAAGGEGRGIALHPKTAVMFPALGDYLSVLNKAVVLDDDELVTYTCRKIARLLTHPERFAVNQ